jgi:hypothetical protein
MSTECSDEEYRSTTKVEFRDRKINGHQVSTWKVLTVFRVNLSECRTVENFDKSQETNGPNGFGVIQGDGSGEDMWRCLIGHSLQELNEVESQTNGLD